MKLSVDIDALKNAATTLRTTHSEYAAEHKKIITYLESTKSFWQGKDSEKAIQAILSFEPNLKKIEDLIGMYSDFLTRVADSYDKIDSQIYTLISNC